MSEEDREYIKEVLIEEMRNLNLSSAPTDHDQVNTNNEDCDIFGFDTIVQENTSNSFYSEMDKYLLLDWQKEDALEWYCKNKFSLPNLSKLACQYL